MNKEKKKRISQAIKDTEDINRVRSFLHEKPRDLLLFDLATHTGIGLKKLLNLKTYHLLNLNVGDKIPIEESGNGKYSIVITNTIHETFHEYLNKTDPEPDDYLFKSKKGNNPINVSSASNMINNWFRAVGLENIHGARSLRKTWEYNYINSFPNARNNNSLDSVGLFKPIKTPTAQEIIYKELSKAIISCRIPPGTRLTATEISKAFNVSKAPARTALNWLEAKGFIISQRQKASIVKKLSFEELKEFMDIRLVLEIAAVDFAIDKCTEETLDLAEDILCQIKKSKTFEQHDELNARFHKVIVRDANMPHLMQMISDLCDRLSPYVFLYNSKKNKNSMRSHAYKPIGELYHHKILEGMRKRDRDKVIKYLTLDLNKFTPEFEKFLK